VNEPWHAEASWRGTLRPGGSGGAMPEQLESTDGAVVRTDERGVTPLQTALAGRMLGT
jgi:hypothetical protein